MAWMARCKRCKAVRRLETRTEWYAKGEIIQCWNGCRSRVINGTTIEINTIKGRVTDHQCDARCINSKGPVCECSCGGANHGRGWTPTPVAT